VFCVNTSSCNACDTEIHSILLRYVNTSSLNIKLVHDPKSANVLMVTGACNILCREILKEIYCKLSDPKVVIAVGTCACSKGVFYDSPIMLGVDNIIPVDIYVPGCPPGPKQIIDSLIIASSIISGDDDIEESLEDYLQSGAGIPIVDTSKCKLCGTCERNCPSLAIKVDKNQRVIRIEYIRCIQCRQCELSCPTGAISLKGFHRVLRANEKESYVGVFKVDSPK